MTQPRFITPGATYLITRRCYQRTFRLRPSALTNQILAYCLALALEKTGVVLHAACFMSNHHHLVVSDPRGALPEFRRELHRSTAKAVNAERSRKAKLRSNQALCGYDGRAEARPSEVGGRALLPWSVPSIAIRWSRRSCAH